MAVTKIWPVRGRLDHPIAYAMNPEKTDAKLLPDSLEDVMNYAVNEEKTEKKFYVSGVNCNPAIARSEFQIVKEQYGKPSGIIVYHAYQSFSEGEVTPAEAHRIGMEFAKTVWGDKYQVVVATHLNTHCLHNCKCQYKNVGKVENNNVGFCYSSAACVSIRDRTSLMRYDGPFMEIIVE